MLRNLLLLALITAVASAAFGKSLKRYVFSEPHMGTLVHITVYASAKASAETAARQAFDRIDYLDSILSDYDPESELMRLSRQPIGSPTQVSEDVFTVLERSRYFAELTGGAFDATAGPVTRLWRKARREHALPDPATLEEALASVNYRALELESSTRTVTLRDSGMQLDLGGIAKGYAAEEALTILRAHNLPRALVAVSGDLAIGDPPPGEAGWRVGIASLDATRNRVTKALTLSRIAISTSGDTEQFLEIDGERYSHIVDPRTGIGLTTRTGVTVLAPDATTADALATSVSVLGPELGLALIEKLPDIEALIVELTDDGYRKIESRGFSTVVANDKPPGQTRGATLPKAVE